MASTTHTPSNSEVTELERLRAELDVATAELAHARATVARATTTRWTALDAEAVTVIRDRARPALAPCLCGCGETTKGRFYPGHDATLKETLKATIVRGEGDAPEIAREAMAGMGWTV